MRAIAFQAGSLAKERLPNLHICRNPFVAIDSPCKSALAGRERSSAGRRSAMRKRERVTQRCFHLKTQIPESPPRLPKLGTKRNHNLQKLPKVTSKIRFPAPPRKFGGF